MAQKKLPWVQGNKLELALPLTMVVFKEEGKEVKDYIPQTGDEVKVYLQDMFCKSYEYTPTIVDGSNVLHITDNGTLPVGSYSVLVTIKEHNGGALRRSKWNYIIEVYDSNEKVVDFFDDFPDYVEGAVIENSVFYFVGGSSEQSDWNETDVNSYAYIKNKPDLSTKQDRLVSGTNIKTVDNTSLLGSGNIAVQSLGVIDLGTQSNFVGTYPDGYYTISYSGSSTLIDAVNAIWESGKIPLLKMELSSHTSTYSIPLYKAPNNVFNGHDRAENDNYSIDVQISSYQQRIYTRSIGSYSKPSNGIPATDLAQAVRTSLSKADAAQPKATYSEITAASTAALSLGYDYYVSSALGTYEFTLADNPSNGELSVIFSTGNEPSVEIIIDVEEEQVQVSTLYVQEGFSIDANSTYEMNIKALNGSYYIVLVKMEAV